jgi:hypothetical protein
MEYLEDEEYKKGFDRGLEGRRSANSLLDLLNIFRSEQEKEARKRGFRHGHQELERRKVQG